MLTTFMKKTAKFISTVIVFTSIASLSTLFLISHSASAAELKINVKEISENKGHLMVALFSGKESYTKGKSQWSSMVKVSKSEEVITFSDLPDGEYAIKLFHDENDNKKLDFNMLGIPKESYGFSNNVGQFGQPDYKEAKFTVKENTMIDINLF
ncbi:MAG: DUF2141 domain-containing protein [Alteromonadaceae bacterium]|nr:DUF2141 domain-containing protein [Alteromonadaceae bacterium]